MHVVFGLYFKITKVQFQNGIFTVYTLVMYATNESDSSIV